MFLKKYLLYGLTLVSIVLAAVLVTCDLTPRLQPGLLTDPFLQQPGKNAVHVVWFTEFAGRRHLVTYGADLDRTVAARTTQLSRIREKESDGFVQRSIWRHEAVVEGLTPGRRVPYFVTSELKPGFEIKSDVFSLQPLPAPGQPLNILLTSDHQQKPMTPANLQKVVETVGRVDAVFFAGDLTNVPDNAREWFDDPRGLGFFAALQGRTRVFNPDHPYRGGRILQHAPIFPCVGNHEVMGRFDGRFADFKGGRPRWYAKMRYDETQANTGRGDVPQPRTEWIRDQSFNTITYEEIFSLPDAGPGGELYYDLRFGDIYLASLFVTRHWRTPNINDPKGGKFHEGRPQDPEAWLFGDFIFEGFGAGSRQHRWLEKALQSPECIRARYRVVMCHQTSRGPGGNSVPLMAPPLAAVEYVDSGGNPEVAFFDFPPAQDTWYHRLKPLLPKAEKVRYDYPRQRDHWRVDIEPLLADARVGLVLHGHSHLWYRMKSRAGMVYLETSNVGNSYGAYLRGYKARNNVPPPDSAYWDPANYAAYDDAYGQRVDRPSIMAPMNHRGRVLPTVDSNHLTVFSVWDTATGVVSSYVFDTRHPDDRVLKFDEFTVPPADR